MSTLTDSYRRPTEAEKRLFRERCIGGMDPKVRCPLCNTRRQTREVFFRFCDEHLSWERASLHVSCHVCRVNYGVVLHDDEHVAGEKGDQ